MKALIIVDVQNDFMPGGPLEVADGDAIVPEINRIMHQYDLIVATQDWHPPGHRSFASAHSGEQVFDTITLNGLEQILWPDHCVQGTSGAAFHKDLNMNPVEAVFRKGMDPEIDSYSGFYDNGRRKSTGLAGYLREKNAQELYFCGLAGDICVYSTLRDALKEGFKSRLVLKGTRSLDNEQFKKCLVTMQMDGAEIV